MRKVLLLSGIVLTSLVTSVMVVDTDASAPPTTDPAVQEQEAQATDGVGTEATATAPPTTVAETTAPPPTVVDTTEASVPATSTSDITSGTQPSSVSQAPSTTIEVVDTQLVPTTGQPTTPTVESVTTTAPPVPGVPLAAATATISGRVTGPEGEPVANLMVTASGDGWDATPTGADGTYELQVPPGNYIIAFDANFPSESPYLDEWFNDAKTWEDADLVVVDSDGVTGIDAELALKPTISGRVTGPDGEPIGGIMVTATGVELSVSAGGYTAADGTYELLVDLLLVPPVSFRIQFSAGLPYLGEYFDDAQTAGDADLVIVGSNGVTGIDAELARAQVATISGRVTGPDGEPIADVAVWAMPPGTGGSVAGYTAADGTYELTVTPGSYTIWFLPGLPYISEYFDDAQTWQDIDPVIVGSDAVTGIDAELARIPQRVTATAGVDPGYVPWLAFTNTGTADISVEMWGRLFPWLQDNAPTQSASLIPGTIVSPGNTWRPPWPWGFFGDYAYAVEWRAYTVPDGTLFDSGSFLLSDVAGTATVPAAPTLWGTAGDTLVNLRWNRPSDGHSPLTAFAIEINDGSGWEPLTTVDATVTNHTVDGLINGTEYSFRVAAVNAVGTGPMSTPFSTTPRRVPDAPQLTNAAPGNGSVTLNWTTPNEGGSPITDYVIQRSTDGTTWTPVSDGTSTAPTYTVTGLTNGTPYWFRVAAVNEFGTGPLSNSFSSTPRTTPDAPRITSATPGNGSVTLNWTAPYDGGSPITDYVIQRSTDGTTWTPDGTSTAPTYTVTALTNGTEYSFRVTARNAAGSSAASPTVTVTPQGPPLAPESLTATPDASQRVTLSWFPPVSDGGSPITGYIIQQSLDGTSNWKTIDDGVSITATYTVTGLINGTRYYFQVLARNEIGDSSPSNVDSAVPRTVASAPRTLTAGPTNLSGQIRLSWQSPASDGGAAITDYIIQRSPNGTTGWLPVTDGKGTTTSYTVTRLTSGVRCYFRVLAHNAAGNSAWSNVTSAIPSVPSAPRTLTATPGNGRVTLKWLLPTAHGGAAITDYIVQRSANGTSSWVPVNDGVRTTTTYTVTGLTNGTRYYFRVLAKNVVGSGAPSNVVSQVPRTVPSAPRTVTATPGSGRVVLKWTAPASTGGAPIIRYAIQRSASPTSGWVYLSTTTPATARSFTATNLRNGTRYYFRIVAVNAAGLGPWSAPVSTVPR